MSFLTRKFQAQMLLGEFMLLCIAAFDRLLQAVSFGLLRISAERPIRPSASQFAKQQQKFATLTSSSASSSSSTASFPTSTTTTNVSTTQANLDAVIIGGGAAGVSTAAALSRAGLSSTIVIEKNASAGDVWRKRYASLTLHDIADDCSLPFVPIPESLPVYIPASVFADYLDFHARIHRVDFRGGMEAVSVEPIRSSSSSSSSSSNGDRWRVRARAVAVADGDGDGDASSSSSPSTSCFEAENVIFCDGGLYNSPKIPDFARDAWEASNRKRNNNSNNKKGDKRATADDVPESSPSSSSSSFQGEVIHSSQLSSRDGSCSRFAGKRALVVGFGNSAMDVCQELVSAGARSVTVAVRDPTRRAVVPLLAYGAYQEQLAKYPWLLWPERAASFLEQQQQLRKRQKRKKNDEIDDDVDDDDIDDDDYFDKSAPAALLSSLASALLSTLVAPVLAPVLRRVAADVDFLLDAATAARSLRAWAALGARGGDLSPYGLSTLPGGKGDCGPVTWTKKTANVLVMDTGAVKEIIRGNAKVVVAAVERLGPGKRVSLRATTPPPPLPQTPTAATPMAAATATATSASPLTAALLRSVGGEVPGGEAPVLTPAPPFVDDVDVVILCTGFDTMQQCYSLVSDAETLRKLGNKGASGYLVPPDQRGSGAIECGKPVRGVKGMFFVYGRLTQVRDGALAVARRVSRSRERARARARRARKMEGGKGSTASTTTKAAVVANGGSGGKRD